MTLPRLLLLFSIMLALGQSATAVMITFDAASDYDTNFWEPGTANPSTQSWDASGYLHKVGSTTTAIYSPGSTGAPATGAGGAVEGTSSTAGVNTRIRADFSTSHLNGGNSFGFYTSVNADETSGYAVIFRITSSTSADFRVFDTATNPSTAGAASQIGGVSGGMTFTGAFEVDTFYTFQLDLIQSGANLNFVASMYTTGVTPTQIDVTRTIVDSTSPVTSGQIGLRLNASATVTDPYVRADNFSIETIPEPGSGGLLAFGGLALAIIRRRRK